MQNATRFPHSKERWGGAHAGGIAHFARFQEIYVGKLYRHNDTADSGPTGAMAAPVRFQPRTHPVRSRGVLHGRAYGGGRRLLQINFSAVFDFHPNPAAADHLAGSKERAALSGFAGNYTARLVQLHDVFNGAPENFMSTIGAPRGAAARRPASDEIFSK